jgi:hypothetical protein
VARKYLEVAELVLGEDLVDATVATGNAVLAAIAAADAICCAVAGQMHRGADHRAAAAHLQRVSGDPRLAGLLRDVVDLKDQSHYGVRSILVDRARVAVKKAKQLLDVAERQEM